MKKYELIVFDLDGTLVDSGDTIYHATIAAFEKQNMKVDIPKAELDKRIGAHFADIFDDLKIEVIDVEEYINVFKGLYFNFIDKSKMYDGAIEALYKISSAGYKTGLLTTKGQDQADNITAHFKLTEYLDYVMGRRPGFEHKPHPQPLLHICSELNAAPENTLMVGDSEYDIRCGKNAGVDTCAVSYGFRDVAFLEAEEPDYLIHTPTELLDIIKT